MKVIDRIVKLFHRYRDEDTDITLEEAEDILKNTPDAILIDVRSPQEYKEGHLDGAINLPNYEIEQKAEKVLLRKEQAIIVYCSSGTRSKKAMRELKELGYEDVYNVVQGVSYF